MKLPTVEELLLDTIDPRNVGYTNLSKYKNFYRWCVFNSDSNFVIRIRHTWYIKKLDPITCDTGNFYDKETNECLGKSFIQYIYFCDKADEEFEFPKLVPDVEWRPE